tara:strand:+ start:317 stop:619 length:303 start_codon:yes stop_codon:yes gene_type:complete
MKKINLILILIFLVLSACGNVGKILRNEKINTTDEFLVKKKKPLILPPDLDQIPEPGTKVEKKSEEKDALKEILKQNTKVKKSSEKSSSIEESIIKRLPK